MLLYLGAISLNWDKTLAYFVHHCFCMVCSNVNSLLAARFKKQWDPTMSQDWGLSASGTFWSQPKYSYQLERQNIGSVAEMLSHSLCDKSITWFRHCRKQSGKVSKTGGRTTRWNSCTTPEHGHRRILSHHWDTCPFMLIAAVFIIATQ